MGYLKRWIAAREIIILSIDLNEYIIKKELAIEIQQLGSKEAIIDRYAGLNQPIHQRGQFPIK